MLLRYRGRSEKELRERLGKKGHQPEDIEAALVNLRQAGFVDDEALAENLKRQAMTNKLLGFNGARRFMQQRGIPRAVIDRTLAYNEETELLAVEKLINKKQRTIEKYPEPKRTRSLIGFLLRKGYSQHIIRKALKNRCRDEEMEG
jgi:regulatory protein